MAISGNVIFSVTTVAPVQVSGTTIFTSYPIGTLGTAFAKRILTYPNNFYVPITYDYNPGEDENIDNDVIYQLDYAQEKTYSGNATFGFAKVKKDIIVTETWQNMDLAFFRKLYNYYINPPTVQGQYITWQPRDKNALTYNVKIVGLYSTKGKVKTSVAPNGTIFKNTPITIELKIIS